MVCTGVRRALCGRNTVSFYGVWIGGMLRCFRNVCMGRIFTRGSYWGILRSPRSSSGLLGVTRLLWGLLKPPGMSLCTSMKHPPADIRPTARSWSNVGGQNLALLEKKETEKFKSDVQKEEKKEISLDVEKMEGELQLVVEIDAKKANHVGSAESRKERISIGCAERIREEESIACGAF